MKIVRISKNPSCLVFKNGTVPETIALEVSYKGENGDSTPTFLDIESVEDFQEAISIEKEQDKHTINGFFSSGDFRENQVFIVLDDWRELGSFDKGYDMARDLLNTVGKSKVFNLYFVSLFTRECLLRMVKDDENRTMINTFPHLCIADLKVSLSTEAYSNLHFRLIRDVAVSNKGRLSAIRHDVLTAVPKENLTDERLKEYCIAQKQHILGILDKLDFKPYCNCYPKCKDRIGELRIKVENLSSENAFGGLEKALQGLRNEVFGLIDRIADRLANEPKEGEQGKTKLIKEDYRVLIIDDDPDQRQRLYNFFSKRYNHVACNDMWEIVYDGPTGFFPEIESLTLKEPASALRWFEKEENLQGFDIIVLDLLFKKQEEWLPFNGLDLLRRVRIYSPYSVVRVITSLPRNEISAILGEVNMDLPMHHIFTKSNGWNQLENCLCDRKDEIENDCKSNAQLRDFAKGMRGPSRGFFNKASVRRMMAELRNMKVGDQTTFDICFQNAQKMLDPSFIKDNPRDSITLPKHESGIIYDDTVLTNYMAHRIAFLQWSANHFPGQLRGIDIDEYHVALEDLHIKKKEEDGKVKTPGKTYFHDLGFGFSEKKHKKTVTLSFGDMFPEEVELFKQIARGKGLSVQVSDDVCNWIFGVVKNGCYDLKDDDVIFKDFSVEQVFTYAKVKVLFDKCCRIVSDGSSGPGIADRNKRIVDFLESMFLRESFNDEGIGDSYDAVMAKLKEQGIFMPIISETCVKEWVKKVLKKGGCERMFGEFPSETIFNTIANSALVTYDDINELVEVRNNARNNPIYTSQDKSKMESFFNRVLSTEQYPEVMAVLKEKGIIEP